MNSLKYIIVVLISFNTTISFSQKNNFTVSTPNYTVLYKGFDNIIDIGFVKKKVKYRIECIGCDTLIKLKKFENKYVIRAGVDSLASIEILIKSKKGKLLQSVIYKTFLPPKPIIKLDSCFGFDSIVSIPTKIRVVREKSVGLTINYGIRNWKISLGNKIFTGKGYVISNDVIDFMKLEKNGLVIVEVQYIDPVSRKKDQKIIEAFILNL